MKPEPSAFTSFCSRIGSPCINGTRAIEPAIWVCASGLLSRRMKALLAVDRRPGLPLQVFGLHGLAELDVGLRDQDLDRRQLLGDREDAGAGCVLVAARQIRGDAAGAQRDDENDNACGVHTLLLLRGALEPHVAGSPASMSRQ